MGPLPALAASASESTDVVVIPRVADRAAEDAYQCHRCVLIYLVTGGDAKKQAAGHASDSVFL